MSIPITLLEAFGLYLIRTSALILGSPLLGSGTTSYRGALAWATVTTALGSLTALVVARELLAAFSGKGLVPIEVVSDPAFPAAVHKNQLGASTFQFSDLLGRLETGNPMN